MSRNPYREYVENCIHGISRTERQVLDKLCGFMEGKKARRCMDASLETMEKWFTVERSTIRRAIQSLEEKGVIICTPVVGKSNRIIFSSLFWEAFDNNTDWRFKKAPTAKCHTGGSKMPRHPRQNATQQRDREYTEIVSNYNKGFPSLHYASVNLIPVPANLSAQDTFPSGGVL